MTTTPYRTDASASTQASPVDVDHLLANRQALELAVDAGDAWRKVNDASIDEYMEHHAAEQYPEMVKTHMALFSGFIARHLMAVGGRTVLDVGCGIGSQHPLYVRDLANAIEYVGLDPIQLNLVREYPFICGRLEDLARQGLSRPADVVVFATSLDHFESAVTALQLGRALAGNGRILLWIGLHDSPAVASIVGAKVFARICDMTSSAVLRFLGLIAYCASRAPKLLLQLRRREALLATGGRLDKFHFHYFLREPLRELLAANGTVEEFLMVPGSNSCFVALGPHR